MKKNLCIIIAGTPAHLQYISILCMSLKKYSYYLIDDIYVYGQFSYLDIKTLNKIWNKIHVKQVSQISIFKNFNADTQQILKQSPTEQTNFNMYYKFFVFEYLDKYKRAMWIDADTMALDSFDVIFNKYKDYDIVARLGGEQKRALGTLNFLKENIDKYDFHQHILELVNKIKNIDITKSMLRKPNGGFVCVSDTILQKANVSSGKELTKQCFIFTEVFFMMLKVIHRKFTLVQTDELPFAFIQLKYNLEFGNSTDDINVFIYEPKKNPILVHFTGSFSTTSGTIAKIDKNPLVAISFPEYFVYLQKFNKILNNNLKNCNVSITNKYINEFRNNDIKIFKDINYYSVFNFLFLSNKKLELLPTLKDIIYTQYIRHRSFYIDYIQDIRFIDIIPLIDNLGNKFFFRIRLFYLYGATPNASCQFVCDKQVSFSFNENVIVDNIFNNMKDKVSIIRKNENEIYNYLDVGITRFDIKEIKNVLNNFIDLFFKEYDSFSCSCKI